tara:strand:+ start:361 stop:1020 length:660 start_codon:yes stop_codon:yes gene_type:complete
LALNTKYLISPEISKFHRFSPKLKVAILASGKGTNFLNLINLANKSELDIEIKILISNKDDAGCLKKAKDHNIPFSIIKEKDFINNELFEEEIINILLTNNIELVVLAGWMRIISERFINSFKNKIINIHPSLLPSFKGKNAINDSLAKGVYFTGCSVHFVEKDVDSGKLIIQAVLPIQDNDNYEMLSKKINFLEHKILPFGISEAGYNIRRNSMDKNL